MRYDFDRIIDRRSTNSMKWNVAEGELPMWVADMDFATVPEVTEMLQRRAAHGLFGYAEETDQWRQAYARWWRERHHFEMEEDWLVFSTGVVPTISSAVRKLTTPNENVVIQTPVYHVFFNSILNNGCRALENRLIYRDGVYEMDFDDLERKLADPQTTLMILCNPHNPVGKIWDRQTLARIGELCEKYHVTVISDEIHCDLTDPGKEYIPFASVSDTCKRISVTCMAPTKTFNLAGLQTSAAMVPDPFLRHKIWRAVNTDEVGEPGAFAVEAAVTAYTYGAPWLDALREYICESKQMVSDFVKEQLPQLHLVPSEATYLLWLDCGRLLVAGGKQVGVGADGGRTAGERTDGTAAGTAAEPTAEELAAFIRHETGLYLSAGNEFGGNGSNFLRMNIACPKTVLRDGLERLKRGCDAWSKR